MPNDQRTIPITKGRPQLVTQRPPAPPPPLADRRFGDRRKPLPPPAWDKIVWPLVVGLCLGFLAPEALNLADRLGHWGGKFFFPFTLLAARPEFGYGSAVANVLSTIALYVQFPIEGALAMLNLRRHTPLRSTMSRLAMLHIAGAALLWLLDRPHIR
jgi:hypothetical protein